MHIRLMLLATLALAFLVSGCVETNAVPKDESAEQRVLIPVRAAQPGHADVSAYFETTTRVQAENRVDVIAKGMGKCVLLNVEEGDHVEAGDVLAELDKTEFEAQIAQTRVNVRMSEFQMQKAQEQHAEGLISEFEAKNAAFSYEQAAATLNLQEVKLADQTIRAPISGVVTTRLIQEGMLVSTGTPAFSIVDPESYILPISPPEKELHRLSIGQQAHVNIDSCQDRDFIAKVRRINPSVDPLSGTVKVTLDFAPEDRSYLREAAFARVKLIMETHANALIVPKDAIIEENARTYLMVLRPESSKEAEEAGAPDTPAHIADRVEVQTGLEDSNNIEILSGIEPGASIVTLGQHTLKPGSAVAIADTEDKTPESEEASAAAA